jgi:cytochrome c553
VTGRIARASLFFAALLGALAAQGETPARAGEPWSLGAYLSDGCAPCHGARDDGIPAIAGWPEDKIRARLAEYRSGERTHDIMANVARSLSETEAVAVAQHLSRLAPVRAEP